MRRIEKSRRSADSGESGFIYIWALFLVVLINFGLATAVEVEETTARREKEKELLAIGRQFRAGLESYVAARASVEPNAYPKSFNDLLQDERAGVVKRHLRKVFVDPMTGKPEWGLVLVNDRIVGVHSLSKQLPIRQHEGQLDGISLTGKAGYNEWVFSYP